MNPLKRAAASVALQSFLLSTSQALLLRPMAMRCYFCRACLDCSLASGHCKSAAVDMWGARCEWLWGNKVPDTLSARAALSPNPASAVAAAAVRMMQSRTPLMGRSRCSAPSLLESLQAVEKYVTNQHSFISILSPCRARL
jgi:hypothetical protein